MINSFNMTRSQKFLLISYDSNRVIVYDLEQNEIKHEFISYWTLQHIQGIQEFEYIIGEITPG